MNNLKDEDLIAFNNTLQQLRSCGIEPVEGSLGILGLGGLQRAQPQTAPVFSSSTESERVHNNTVGGKSQPGLTGIDVPNLVVTQPISQVRTTPVFAPNELRPDLSRQELPDLTTLYASPAVPTSRAAVESAIVQGPAAPPTSAPRETPALPIIGELPVAAATSAGTACMPLVPSEVTANGRVMFRGKTLRKHIRTKKIESYFDAITSHERESQKISYQCNKCSFVVTQKKLRERLFHIILCPRIPISIRCHYYENCNDADRPPLLQYPPFGLTARSAKRLAIQESQNLVSRYNCLMMTFDPSREPRYAQYLLEKERVKSSTPIGKCSDHESKVATNLLMQFIVEENIPFAVCDNQESYPRPLARFVRYLRPGYKMPAGYRVGGSLLNEYYTTLKKDIQNKLQNLMLECRGTLMFDGSEDVNGAPMINILLRIMGSARISTTTFFLTTIYTGYDTVDAKYYVRMAEKVVEEFGGFSNIAGVVTDNTGCVKNAREILEKRHPRLVASQDQAHVADRLISDIGDLAWIAGTLTKLSTISSVLRRFRKLRARYIEYMTEYNKSVGRIPRAVCTQNARGDGDPSNANSEPSGAGSTADKDAELSSEDSLYERDSELGQLHLPLPFFGNELFTAEKNEGEDDDSEGGGEIDTSASDSGANSEVLNAPSVPSRTAVTLKKLSNVRFASREGLLDEFIRSRPVLQLLVKDNLFDTLYIAKNVSEREKRNASFRDPVLDEDFFKTVTQIHRIFRACRTYLRVFDSETSIVSEVFEATRILKETFERMPPDFFPEPKMENRQELLDVFENRRIGPLPGRKNIKISLLSDLHTAAALLDPYRTPKQALPHIDAFNRHLDRYLSGLDISTLGIEKSRKKAFKQEIMEQYMIARAIWADHGIMKETSEITPLSRTDNDELDSRPSGNIVNTKNPIAWWSTGELSKPSNFFQRMAVEELIEFAIRTLSVSPTATATERTFSLENRIHSSQRASLSPEKVRKMLFCQWNSRVLRRSVRRDDVDLRMEAERQVEGMRKLRSVRSEITTESARLGSSAATVVPPPQCSNVRTPPVHAQQVVGRERDPVGGTNFVIEGDTQDSAPRILEPIIANSTPTFQVQRFSGTDEDQAGSCQHRERPKPDQNLHLGGAAATGMVQGSRKSGPQGSSALEKNSWLAGMFEAALRNTLPAVRNPDRPVASRSINRSYGNPASVDDTLDGVGNSGDEEIESPSQNKKRRLS